MGRRTVADTKAVEGHAAALRAAGVRFQTGVLIGSRDEDRTLVTYLAPTPSPDPSASFSTLKTSWISEHWRQVSRMLPGGLAVVGLYAFAPLDESEQHVLQLKGALRTAASKRLPGVEHLRELILLRICATSKQYVTKCITIGPKIEERPADLVFENVLNSTALVRTTFAYEVTMIITKEEIALATQIQEGLQSLYQEIEKASVISDGTASYQFYMPISLGHLSNKAREGDARVRVTVSVNAVAFILQKNPSMAQIEQALKDDVIRSISSRFNVTCEELDRIAAGKINPLGPDVAPLPPDFTWPLSTRAIVSTRTLYFSDYIVPGEGKKEVLERAKEMLGLQSLDVTDILIDEPVSVLNLTLPESASLLVPPEKHIAGSLAARQPTPSSSSSSSAFPMLIVFAALVVVLAICAALFLRAPSSHSH